MADPRVDEVDDFEDDEIRQAIALSLGCDPQEWRRKNVRRVIDLTEDADSSGQGGGGGDPKDDGDDDLVIIHHGNASRAEPVSQQTAAATTEERTAPSTSLFSALGMDRKKMEEERLARLHKRKASQVDVGDGDDVHLPSRPVQRPKMTVEGPSSSGEKEKTTGPKGTPSSATLSSAPKPKVPKDPPPSSTPPTNPGDTNSAAPEAAAPASSSRPPLALPFPRGVLKKTWAYQQPRKGDDIKIEEVLQKQDLQLAVVSSFQWDEHWMLSKIDITRTKLVLVAFAANEAQKQEMRANVPGDRIRFCFPPMHGIGAMHSKLMLLKYEGYMRIVVPTGNFMSYDWGETGTMENMVFIIDLPKFENVEQREAQKPTAFALDLFYFLRAQGLDENLISSLKNYDFTETRRYQFVHTIPGSHSEEDSWRQTGYVSLGDAVRALIHPTTDPIDIDIVCASLGAINYNFMAAMYYACLGDPLIEYEARTGAKSKREDFNDRAKYLVDKHMRVFFPSRETVLQSKGGKEGAGTICFQSKWWQAPSFPRQVLRDCKSVRPGVLMHSKIIYIRPNDPGIRWNKCLAYVGSANLSESAWGKLVRDRVTKEPKLTCRNWECGVLVPIEDSPEHSSEEDIHRQVAAGARVITDRRAAPHAARGLEGLGLADFEGAVPVPMEWPGRVICEAGAGAGAEARRPWMFEE